MLSKHASVEILICWDIQIHSFYQITCLNMIFFSAISNNKFLLFLLSLSLDSFCTSLHHSFLLLLTKLRMFGQFQMLCLLTVFEQMSHSVPENQQLQTDRKKTHWYFSFLANCVNIAYYVQNNLSKCCLCHTGSLQVFQFMVNV